MTAPAIVFRVEGVPYYRFRVTIRLADGRRRRWIRCCPGITWIGGEVCRELCARFDRGQVAHGSLRIAGPL